MRRHTQWRWRLDEVYVRINGDMRYLSRAIDHQGEMLESFVTKERDKAAALKELRAGEKREVGIWTNTRVENSHQPFRRRECAILRFRRMKTPQAFALVHASSHKHFNQERHLTSRDTFKGERSAALTARRTLGA